MSFFADNWYRVAPLRPRLRAHVRSHRHVYRDRVWYLVQDNQTGKFHRLSGATHEALLLMNGKRSVAEIWDVLVTKLGADQPSQTDLVRLLALLNQADLLRSGTTPYLEELDHRARKTARKDLLGRIKNPLAIRVPLLDLDRFLQRSLPYVRWLFGPMGLLLWVILVGAGATVAVMQSDVIAAALSRDLLARDTLIMMALSYPVVKALHELGHAYATRHWGGEVQEIGVMLLVLFPVPYVDASAALAFENKWHRATVAAAGILVELAIASAAVVFWALAEPGFARDLALNVAILGGVSTLLFNGNPLLRFDGYHVLSDLVEIPNLGKRANTHLLNLIQRHLLRRMDVESAVTAPGEARWFTGYGLAALAYRLVILWVIVLFLATAFGAVGVALAAVALWTAIAWPILKGARFLALNPALTGRRGRAIANTGAVLAGLVVLLFLVPVPQQTVTSGVVWVSAEDAGIRTQGSGETADLPMPAATGVEAGQVLVRLENPDLAAELRAAHAALRELQARADQAGLAARAQQDILRQAIAQSAERVRYLEEEQDRLIARAPKAGLFLPLDPTDSLNRPTDRGSLLGYLVQPEDVVIRTLVPHTRVDLVRADTLQAEVKLRDGYGQVRAASALRSVPAAITELPHPALAVPNGGSIAIDPQRGDALIPLEPVFQMDLQLSELLDEVRLGLRADVRFTHSPRPFGLQIWDGARQVFLRSFNL